MKSKQGFTLVELLVVIAIIGILIGMLLPAVQQVRAAARRTQCANNSRQVGLALLNYESAQQEFPAGWVTGIANNPLAEPGWGWSAKILPFVDAGNLYKQIDFSVAIDDHVHESAIATTIPVFLCPSETVEEIVNLDIHVEHGEHDHENLRQDDHDHGHGELWVSRSNYSGCFGSTEIEDSPLRGNGMFFANSKTAMRDVVDGSSNTIIVGERRNELGPISWVGMVPEVDEPFARIVAVTDHAPNHSDQHFEDFGSNHSGGINVTLVDGSTHFVSDNVDSSVFQAMGTRSGRETITIE